MLAGRLIYGSYEKTYISCVENIENRSPTSKVSPLPEIAAVYLLAQAALCNLLTIKGHRVNLKMDSVIDYKGGMANVCIETLQCMLFDRRDKVEESTLGLDQLRIYPVLVNSFPELTMQGLQSCYLKHTRKIVQIVKGICTQHLIELPETCWDYNPMNPKHVVGWLEEILLENRVSPQYIAAAVRAMSAIGDLETSMVKHWVDVCLSDYLHRFEKQSISRTTQSLSAVVSEQTLQRQSEEITRKQLDALLQQIAKRKQNQSVNLEVQQRVSC